MLASVGVLSVVWSIARAAPTERAALAQANQGDNWTTPEAQRLGVRLLETREARGPSAYPVRSGDVLFFTNSGTNFGAKNPKNSVVVVNATTKQPIAVSDLDDRYTSSYSSHGIGVSHEGRYVYLPSMDNISNPWIPEYTLILDARTLAR
jgi:hypothetical protein